MRRVKQRPFGSIIRPFTRRQGVANQMSANTRAAGEAPVGLQVATREAGDVVILDLEGRLTIGPGTDLLTTQLRSLIEGGARKVLLNLAGLTQIDSSGISAVVRAFITLRRSGGSLKLLGAAGRVLEVLSVTRLLSAMPNFDAEPAALASFR